VLFAVFTNRVKLVGDPSIEPAIVHAYGQCPDGPYLSANRTE
jgi:hypothetical protein